MNLISMDKKYRRRGGTKPVRVLCVDAIGHKPVVFLDEKHNVIRVSIRGFYNECEARCDLDLVEYIEPNMVPLGPKDIPIGSALQARSYGIGFLAIQSSWEGGVRLVGNKALSHQEMMDEYLINRNDGKGWVDCEKPAQE